MDNQKDNKDKPKITSGVARFFPNFFHNDNRIFRLYRQTDNIVSAIFLIVQAEEDMSNFTNNELKKQALKCLYDINQVVSTSHLVLDKLHIFSASILHLGSLININYWSGLISEMNAQLLQKEVTHIHMLSADLLEEYKNKFLLNTSVFTEYATRNDLNVKDIRETANNNNIGKGHYKGRNIKDNKYVNEGPLNKDKKDMSDTKIARRDKIILLLREKNNLAVKDFLSVIQGFSEKTIQRELLAMVDEGVIKKQGERRWSTYSLV